MDSRYFSLKIVEWYEQYHRKLPWRETKDPYRVWLSEVILQQTRVVQGLPYYQKFVEKFPSVSDLANAEEEDILRLWQGLGYYTRARNLHKCAKEVVAKHEGVFPTSHQILRSLPGIGDYTAAAIASISNLEPVAVIDGNVFRVLSRVFGVKEEISTHTGRKYFFELANAIMDRERPDLYNQAVMEFGALQCLPRQPDCVKCIFHDECVARKTGQQQLLPVKSRAKKSRNRYFYYFVVCSAKGVAMKRRDNKDIWRGLYDFYLVEKGRAYSIQKIASENPTLQDVLSKQSRVTVSKKYKHVLSHQNIHARFIVINQKTSPTLEMGVKFYSRKQLANLPKPILIHRFLADYNIL